MIQFADRQDQLDWMVDPSWQYFRVNVHGRKREIFKWLRECAQGEVVIFGDGSLPKPGMNYNLAQTYFEIQRQNYKIYFENPDTAMMFKLAWGGEV